MELLRFVDRILKRELLRVRSETAERLLFERYGVFINRGGNVGGCAGYGFAAGYTFAAGCGFAAGYLDSS